MDKNVKIGCSILVSKLDSLYGNEKQEENVKGFLPSDDIQNFIRELKEWGKKSEEAEIIVG